MKDNCFTILCWFLPYIILEWIAIPFSTVGEGVEKKQPSCTVGGNANWYNYGEQYGDSLKKLGIKLPYGPTIPLLGIYLEKNVIEKDTHIPQCSLQHYLQ